MLLIELHTETDQVALAVRRITLEVALQRAIVTRLDEVVSGNAKWSMPI